MKSLLLLLALAFSISVFSQDLAPDQNPNYMVSLQKYMSMKDSLMTTMNTTVQQTYKAYDWYQAKLERKQTRVENRNLRRLYNASYNNSYNRWNSPYNYNYYGYNNRWNNSRYYYRPNIGYNTGHWWFWF